MTNTLSFSTNGNAEAVQINEFETDGEKVIKTNITRSTSPDEVQEITDDIMDEIAQGDPDERRKHAEHKALAQQRRRMIPYIIVSSIVIVALVMVVVIMISRKKPAESA